MWVGAQQPRRRLAVPAAARRRRFRPALVALHAKPSRVHGCGPPASLIVDTRCRHSASTYSRGSFSPKAPARYLDTAHEPASWLHNTITLVAGSRK